MQTPGDEGPAERRRTLGEKDPFATPEEERRTDRRLRGRLVAPVTVFTAALGEERAGLTVSSLLVAEGDPPELLAVLDPLSELHRLAEESGRLLVHLLAPGEEVLASFFAGRYPVDPFAEVASTNDPYGPLLAGRRTIVRAGFLSSEPVGFQHLVRARIDSVELAPGETPPLAWYRGAFRRLLD